MTRSSSVVTVTTVLFAVTWLAQRPSSDDEVRTPAKALNPVGVEDEAPSRARCRIDGA